MRSAFDRVVRTLVVSVGLGSVVFSVLGLPAIIEQFNYLNPVYSIIAVTFFLGLPPVMVAVSYLASVKVLRYLAGLHCVIGIVLLSFWVPAMTVDRLPGDQLPWIVNIITLATCMAAIALPFLGAWIYMFTMATLSGFVRYLSYGGGDASIAFQDSVMIVLISGFMMALLQLTLRAGREQDAAALSAQEAAAETASTETLERQRTRYHAFTHDDVLATLLAASQDGATPSDVTKRSALRTLEKMDQFRADLPIQHVLTIGEFESHLRLAAAGVGVPLHSTLSAPGGTDLRIPVEVCDALTEALTEAMRNSVRHGAWPDGKPVRREARASRTADAIEITITDNGRGFNPRRVGIDRLGVRLSILQRVNSQPGGHASVASARGSGTTVTLTWVASLSAEARG
jgi:signal transduction histidine kinase